MKKAGLVLLAGWFSATAADVSAQDSAQGDTMSKDILPGLVAHWCFDDAQNLGADCSGAGFDSIAEGTPEPVPGVVGGAASFDGASWFRVPSPFFLDGLCSATVSTFLWMDDARPQQQIIGTGDVRGGTDPLSFQFQDGWMTNLGYDDTRHSLEIKVERDVVDPLTAKRWIHLAVTLEADDSGSVLQVYLDGALASTRQRSGARCVGYDMPMPAQIGAIHGTQTWHGKLDELRIYNRALQTGEVERLARR